MKVGLKHDYLLSVMARNIYDSQDKIELRNLLQSKRLKGFTKLMETYMMHKANYMNNIKFDSSVSTLSI